MFVVWIAILAQYALNNDAHLRPDILTHRPVNGRVALDGFHQLAGDCVQGFITKHFHGTVVRFQCIVERDLIIGQPKRLAARIGLTDVFRERDQLNSSLAIFALDMEHIFHYYCL